MKIVCISDFEEVGSGYKTICIPLLTGLAQLGHEIKCAAIGYRGTEHNHPFSMIPCPTLDSAMSLASALVPLWQADVFIVALDLPHQQYFYENLKELKKKYICITPLENPPLIPTWAGYLTGMDAVFFISELGKQEAIKAGIDKAEHLVVGIDHKAWRVPSKEEREQIRTNLGIEKDEFVILTVADNQERKNLWAAFSAVQKLKEQTDKKVRYILVTRKDTPFGWKLNDLMLSMGIVKNVQIYERGMPQRDLWGLYAASDVYLQTSKAEGLGIPVMDAMACNVPVIATNTGALRELLADGRGILVPPAYRFTDVWGNEYRDMIDVDQCKEYLKTVSMWKDRVDTSNSMEYIKSRTWDVPVKQMDECIKRICNEQPQTQTPTV